MLYSVVRHYHRSPFGNHQTARINMYEMGKAESRKKRWIFIFFAENILSKLHYKHSCHSSRFNGNNQYKWQWHNKTIITYIIHEFYLGHIHNFGVISYFTKDLLFFSSINSIRFRKHGLLEIATTVRLGLWALPSLIDRVNFYIHFLFHCEFFSWFFDLFYSGNSIAPLSVNPKFYFRKNKFFFQFIDYFEWKNFMIKLHGFWKNGIEIRIHIFLLCGLSASSMPVVKLPTKTLCSHCNFLFNIYSCLSTKPFQLIKRSFKWVIHVIMLCFATMCKFNNLNWP